jgi:hypothetical protein
MKFDCFRILNYRNIKDSGWIDVNSITAFVGQNEAGKSNLFEALCRINPFIAKDKNYNADEDWPVDDWGNKPVGTQNVVCEVKFSLSEEDVSSLFSFSKKAITPTEENATPTTIELPKSLILEGKSYYGAPPHFFIGNVEDLGLDSGLVNQWALNSVPKFVYIKEYEISGSQIELDQLKHRLDNSGWGNLNNEDQTILIILELAKINISDFLQKGSTTEGRTIRSFDKRAASAYLSKQFKSLWRQKDVKFDVEIDTTTLNIFVEDEGIGMPIRLKNRSTGFRWYVSFAWKFTHASAGQYKNCIVLLEEPGVHLHYDGQQDLLGIFENLAQDNTILYTTHLASMVDLRNPERVRIVEVLDKHAVVKTGIVSSQKSPMAVIEASLGLTGSLSGLLGNRQTLIVEGGDDALILQKISGLFKSNGKDGLSDTIYLWPAKGASQTPMYAGFAVGNMWDAGVLLDTDEAGNAAKKKIEELYLSKLPDDTKFFTLQIGKACGISKSDAAIEELFPDEFYIECVCSAYRVSIKKEDLPQDGSPMITKRVEEVLVKHHSFKSLDKGRVMGEMLKKFDTWKKLSDLPHGTEEKAEKLFLAINKSFTRS